MSFEQVYPLHVIILNHNNYDVIKPLYESIVKENKAYPKYLYFIDNGSGEEDGSREFLRTICRNNPFNRYFELPVNVGTTKGWNVGLRYLMEFVPEARFVCFLNSDMIVVRNWDRKMMKIFEKSMDTDSRVGMVSNVLKDYNNKVFVQNDGGDINNPFHYRMGWPYKDFEPHEKNTPIYWGHLGCTIFDMRVFREIGLFDENFFIYSSDFDIQIRLKMAGFYIWHCPDSTAYHKTFHTCNEIKKNPKIQHLMERDGTRFNQKWSKDVIAKFRDYINYWDCNEKDLKDLYGEDTKSFFYEDPEIHEVVI